MLGQEHSAEVLAQVDATRIAARPLCPDQLAGSPQRRPLDMLLSPEIPGLAKQMEVRFEHWIIPTQETPEEKSEKRRQLLLSGFSPSGPGIPLPGNGGSGTGALRKELYCRIRPPAPTRRAPRRIAKRRKQGRPVPGGLFIVTSTGPHFKRYAASRQDPVCRSDYGAKWYSL